MKIASYGILDSHLSEYHIEPDGSLWIHFFHHNNPARKLFSHVTETEKYFWNYEDRDRWMLMHVVNLQSAFDWPDHEFLYI